MPEIYAGTAGWSYKDWVPSFYPKHNSKTFDMLEFYSLYFNLAEVNSSYYVYPAPDIVNGWINKVAANDNFLFSYKLHQDFTHKHVFDRHKIKAVTTNLDLLNEAGKFGGLLIQFPYSFVCNNANAVYLRKILNIFDRYDKIVEVRHNSWNRTRFFDFLGERNTTLCSIDQPVIGESVQFVPLAVNNILYVRFHGRNVEAWKNSIRNFGKEMSYEEQSARYDYLYSPGELIEIDRKLRELFDSVEKVFVIMNNHPHGDAVANAFELLHYLRGGSKVFMPKNIIMAYPRLIKIAG